MRILFLKRQSLGGISTYSAALAEELRSGGEAVTVEDAKSWIPDQTGKPHDKLVSTRLSELARSFDIVHAFGYRCAWGCAEAFRKKRPWVYTAYDLPRTTHPAFIERLTLAKAGLCASRAVYQSLDGEYLPRLRLVRPAIRCDGAAIEREAARLALGLDQGVPVVAAVGRAGAQSGFDALVASAPRLRARLPEAQIVMAGEGDAGVLSEGTRHLGTVDDARMVLAAADLVVVPSRSKGFSMVALEAMAMERPVLVRDAGGLGEMVDVRVSGLTFESDDALGDQMASALQMPMLLESLAGAGRVRAEEVFGLTAGAEAVRKSYAEAQ